MKIILVHGIHVPEKENNMSSLATPLKVYMPEDDIEVFSYGFMGFWEARWDNPKVARDLAHKIGIHKRDGEKVVVITHSNGAAITYLATRKYEAEPDMVININPALDRWRTHKAPWVETIHSNQDRIVDLSQFLPFHIWGDQGRVGYQGSEKNTVNHNASQFPGDMAYGGHCDLFAVRRVAKWANFIANRIRGVLADRRGNDL